MSKFTNIVDKIISELPSYSPSDEVWKNIDEELSKRETVGSFKKYNPPKFVWNNIAKNLEVSKSATLNTKSIKFSLLGIIVAIFITLSFRNYTSNFQLANKIEDNNVIPKPLSLKKNINSTEKEIKSIDEHNIQQEKLSLTTDNEATNKSNNSKFSINSIILIQTEAIPKEENYSNKILKPIGRLNSRSISTNITKLLIDTLIIKNNYANNQPFNIKQQNNSYYSVSFETGLSQTGRRLSGKEQFENLINIKNANETLAISGEFGITLNYHYKNMNFGIGLQYSSFSEKLNYSIDEKVLDPESGSYQIDTVWFVLEEVENWEPVFVGIDLKWVDGYKNITHLISNTNRFSYIYIPVSCGYDIHINKLTLTPTIGFSLGFLNKTTGKLIISDEGDFVDVYSKEYHKTLTTNYLVNLQIAYKLNSNISIYLKPFYKQGINSIYKNYPISGSYNSKGLKFGIDIRL